LPVILLGNGGRREEQHHHDNEVKLFHLEFRFL
jgi:hypothetical protein